MQFVSKMIKSAWMWPHNDVYLIGCQHLNLNVPDVREEIKRISDLQDAIAHDIASGGYGRGRGRGRQSQQRCGEPGRLPAPDRVPVRGRRGGQGAHQAPDARMPHRPEPHSDRVPGRVRGHAGSGGRWYLHRKENDAFYFSKIENLQKRIESRAEAAPQPKVDAEMKRRLEAIFQPINRRRLPGSPRPPEDRRDQAGRSCALP